MLGNPPSRKRLCSITLSPLKSETGLSTSHLLYTSALGKHWYRDKKINEKTSNLTDVTHPSFLLQWRSEGKVNMRSQRWVESLHHKWGSQSPATVVISEFMGTSYHGCFYHKYGKEWLKSLHINHHTHTQTHSRYDPWPMTWDLCSAMDDSVNVSLMSPPYPVTSTSRSGFFTG